MKRFLLLLLMPLAVQTASAQGNNYNIVIELANKTKITLGANDVENLTFNGEALSISGNTIAEMKAEIEELKTIIYKLNPGAFTKTFTVNCVSFKMVKVVGGTFRMGATEEQGSDANQQEYPVHYVTLSDYWIAETEVTQELWTAIMGSNPSFYNGNNQLPVEQVGFNDCQTFITKLNELTGMNFRMPTEAEWEFAARGGICSQGYKYAGSNTIGDVAWYSGNSEGHPHPVGTKAPNELGIYDMSGNVEEWCQDWYDYYSSESQTNPTGPNESMDLGTLGPCRVERGGKYSGDSNCRVSSRFALAISDSYNNVGFRFVQ